MLNRYPDQARARKGFALIGVIFIIFGLAMISITQVIMAVFGILVGLVFFVPAVLFEYLAFAKIEKILGVVFAGW
jgi:hypothetical protein